MGKEERKAKTEERKENEEKERGTVRIPLPHHQELLLQEPRRNQSISSIRRAKRERYGCLSNVDNGCGMARVAYRKEAVSIGTRKEFKICPRSTWREFQNPNDMING